MRLRNAWVSLLGIALAVNTFACGGGQETSNKSAEPSSPSGAPSGQKVDSATAGDVKGVVNVDGAVPKNDVIKMNAEPGLRPRSQGTADLGKLHRRRRWQDARQRVSLRKTGLGNYVFDTPTETAKIDQQQCRYHPHVFGMRVNQPLEILNSDPTLHNIHAMPKGNSEFNNGQPIQGMKMTHTFDKKEVMVPFKCDVHGWMNAYVGVLDHPYFAVTDKSGAFELKSLPPGTYTIEAWHEKLGTQTASVTLGPKETKDVTFSFKASGDCEN